MINVLLRSNLQSRVRITSGLQIRTQLVRDNHVKVNLNMNEAFLRYDKGNETFDFTFRYVNPEFNVDRRFNTVRKANESVKTFLTRLDANIGKKLEDKKRKKKKKNPQYVVEDAVNNVENGKIALMKRNEVIDLEESCTKLLDDPAELKIHILGTDYDIKFNAPEIISMELPESILADFPVYPRELDSIYTDIKKSQFTWYKQTIVDHRLVWLKIGENLLYTPSTADIGCKLKLTCLPVNDRLTGPTIEVVSTFGVQAGPGRCPFEDRQEFTRQKLTGKNFRVVSYNILADTYADSDYSRQVLFPYCPPYALSIDYRKLLIVKELIGYNADIICLQEVDRKVYANDLVPSLSSINYDGVFSTKGETPEGLAVLFDSRRFKIIDNKCVVLSDGIEMNKEFQSVWNRIQNENAKKRFADRNTSIMVVVARSIDNPNKILILGNTHLYFHPDADHVRLLQAFFALTLLRQTAKEIQEMFPEDTVSVMLCGDFNSTPVDGIYELITNKIIPADHKDWKSNAEQIIEDVSLKLDLQLASACGTPEYTNFTADFADCLDYIFYDTEKLKVTQMIPMPQKEELQLHEAIPSVVFPSDHVAIGADLEWSC